MADMVVICERDDVLGTALCRNGCGHSVLVLDPTIELAIAVGARPLCRDCATTLMAEHPEAFTRYDASQPFGPGQASPL